MLRPVTDGVWQLNVWLPHVVNLYVVRTRAGDYLIDGGTRFGVGTVLHDLRRTNVVGVALTHVHPDHQGAAKAVCERFRVPLLCGAEDADAMEGRRPMGPPTALVRVMARLFSGPAHPVAVRLKGGEVLGGEWEVIAAPGHTRGHVIYFRRADGVAVVGDVVRNASLRRGFGWLAETPHAFSEDPWRNRESMRTLVGLKPRLLCPGHGPPTRDASGLERLVWGAG
ncbi:MAG: MBL fold metallo-hydrolase [Gemmataceae bacterium]